MALDSIHILLTRPYSNESHYQMTIDRVFDNMDLLDSVYESLLFDPTDDIDEAEEASEEAVADSEPDSETD